MLLLGPAQARPLQEAALAWPLELCPHSASSPIGCPPPPIPHPPQFFKRKKVL